MAMYDIETPTVLLVGYRGCGKSVLVKRLSGNAWDNTCTNYFASIRITETVLRFPQMTVTVVDCPLQASDSNYELLLADVLASRQFDVIVYCVDGVNKLHLRHIPLLKRKLAPRYGHIKSMTLMTKTDITPSDQYTALMQSVQHQLGDNIIRVSSRTKHGLKQFVNKLRTQPQALGCGAHTTLVDALTVQLVTAPPSEAYDQDYKNVLRQYEDYMKKN